MTLAVSRSVPRTKPWAPPSVASSGSRSSSDDEIPVIVPRVSSRLADRRDVLARPLVGGDAADRGGEADDGVLVVGHRPVTRPAVGSQPQPGDALLGGLQEVGALLAPGVGTVTL